MPKPSEPDIELGCVSEAPGGAAISGIAGETAPKATVVGIEGRAVDSSHGTFRLTPLCFLFLHCFGRAWGQTKKPVSFSEPTAYTGAVPQQRLLAGAKTEGKDLRYTSLAGSSYKELAKGFESKYSRDKRSNPVVARARIS